MRLPCSNAVALARFVSLLNTGLLPPRQDAQECHGSPNLSNAASDSIYDDPNYDADFDRELDEALGLSPSSVRVSDHVFDFNSAYSDAGVDKAFREYSPEVQREAPTAASHQPTSGLAGWSHTPQTGQSSPDQSPLSLVGSHGGDTQGVSQCAAISRQHSKRQRLRSTIERLPKEVQMRVMCFLSAEDLTTTAQTCHCLHILSSEPTLWRRMYCARWGKKGRQRSGRVWKVSQA